MADEKKADKEAAKAAEEQKDALQEMSKEEQIGFHKGSLSVLSKEREEMLKIVSIVEQLLQMHIKALSDFGVDLSEVQEQTKAGDKKEQPQKRVPIENLL
jgi:DNA-binding transcriptional regulator YhcF (GntR family)